MFGKEENDCGMVCVCVLTAGTTETTQDRKEGCFYNEMTIQNPPQYPQ